MSVWTNCLKCWGGGSTNARKIESLPSPPVKERKIIKPVIVQQKKTTVVNRQQIYSSKPPGGGTKTTKIRRQTLPSSPRKGYSYSTYYKDDGDYDNLVKNDYLSSKVLSTNRYNDSNIIKKSSPVFVKSSNNGRNVVLSPIDAKPPPKSTVVSANSVAISTKSLLETDHQDRDELNESLNGVKWNAAKKREQQQRQFSKAQSVESIASLSSDIHKDQWDDIPIKSKSAGNKVYSDEYTAPNTILSPKKSIPMVPNKKFSIRRHSEELTRSPEQIRRVTQPIVAVKKMVSPRKHPETQKSVTVPVTKTTAAPPSPTKAVKSSVSEDKDMNKPYNNPDQALQTALKKMSSEEWEDKVDGLNMIQRLAKYNVNVLSPNIHQVIVALNAEAKNLRSSVSKQALECYSHLFICLKKSMDPEVDKICQVLVAKTGDASNAFIRDESLRALECMVDHTTPYKALFAFTVVGANHKNAVIRSACAQLVQRMVENLGAKKVLSSQREFVEKILLTAVQFANDSQPQPRLHGKTILMMLAQDPDFNNVLSKSVNGTQQDTIRNIVGGAKMKASLSVNGISSTVAKSQPNRAGSIRRKAKIPDEAADSILSAEKEMASGNWEDRFKGVNRFTSLCDSYGSYVGNNVKMLETYMQRLNDINGKVALVALENLPTVLAKVQPHVADALRPVATEMVKNLSAQLPSKNDDVKKAAEKCLDSSIKILEICQNIYSSKSKLVQMHILPVLNDLLKSQLSDPDIRQATVDLAKILSKSMGRKVLIEQSVFGPNEKATLENIV